MKEIKNKRVIMAMSGGIDSSVAAALLKRGSCPELGRRVDIVGVFMKFWPQHHSRAECGVNLNRCCSSESEKRARLVAEKLNIPFYVFNFEKEFKNKVVDYFLKANKAGLTPNPCVVCNKEIKFGLLFKKILSLNADYIATGHYARLRQGKLLMGKDKNKDQSYFLWKLNQKILKRTLFPIGDYTKTEVRSLARGFKLPVLDVPESMEICFIQTTIHPVKSPLRRGVTLSAGQFNRVNDFLRKHLKPKPGPIVEQGKIIGKHQGLCFYTIGQRKGIKLGQGPYYVLDKDIKNNALIVTKNEKDLFSKELIVKDINWISGRAPKFPLKAMVKIRYRHKPGSAVVNLVRDSEDIKKTQDKLISNRVDKNKVVFVKPQRAITPGQSAVFYKGQQLLGGGTIY